MRVIGLDLRFGYYLRFGLDIEDILEYCDFFILPFLFLNYCDIANIKIFKYHGIYRYIGNVSQYCLNIYHLAILHYCQNKRVKIKLSKKI